MKDSRKGVKVLPLISKKFSRSVFFKGEVAEARCFGGEAQGLFKVCNYLVLRSCFWERKLGFQKKRWRRRLAAIFRCRS